MKFHVSSGLLINTFMKISEVSNSPQHYIATVRVVLRNQVAIARTTVAADNIYQARLIVARIYGENNVLGVNQSSQEAFKTPQVQSQAEHRRGSVHGNPHEDKLVSVHPSTVLEMGHARVLTPQELQVKSLSDRAAQYKQQAKQLKARQALQKAQQSLVKASRSVSPR